jgi:hypothetical protein
MFFAGEDNLLIPIHAYPVMNDISFPSKIDLGACPLGECVKRTVKLDCQVISCFGNSTH